VSDADATPAPAGDAAPTAEEPAAEAAVPTATGVVPAPPADGNRPLAELEPAARVDRFSGPAAPYTKPDTVYTATIVTSKGHIVAELYQDTPESLNNFVTLALNGFYDGLTFHRFVEGFVIQGGDPQGDGGGGPGYTIPGEFTHTHPRGALAWARTGDEVNPERRSSGSQFYITLAPTPDLDGAYSVFGQVTEGMDVVDQITQGDVIERIDITTGGPSSLPTPTPTPEPKAPASQSGRPLAAVPVAERADYYNLPPESILEEGKTYQATVKTAKGDIVIDLDAQAAPISVNNLLMLAGLGFYDGMPISYVEKDTYALFGSPGAKPDSDVGYLLPLEANAEASKIITGTVAMYPIPDQSAGDLKASGSQFFISLTELPSGGTALNAFGTVSKGLDIVAQLQTGDPIESVTITAK
jgi:cyclophilin family peptidyl-prolyl cis-trans isomerase